MSNPTQIDAWLEGFPRQEVEDRLRELEVEVTNLREALALHDRVATARDRNGPEPSREEPAPPANRPEAIRQVLRDRRNAPTTPGAIKETMLANGWLEEDQRSLKLFYSAMSTMTKRGHLLRLQDGRYMLPPDKFGGGGEV